MGLVARRPAGHRGCVQPTLAMPAGMAPRSGARTAVAVGGLLALAACVAGSVTAGDPVEGGVRLLAWDLACWLTFAVAAWAVRGLPVRRAVLLVVVGAVGLQAMAMLSPPRTTDDFYRYAWDGRVQAAGIDPYRYTPTDPALAGLRDDWLFPPQCRDAQPACTRMNHPTAPTIYPPVAQAEFTLVHLVTRPLGPDGGRARTWQVTAALLALAVLAGLLLVLRRRGDPRTAVLWAWCPTVILEAGSSGHVDVLAALFVVGAAGAAAAGRRNWSGAALGAAIATKLLPVLLLPALVAPVPGLRAGRAAWLRWARTRLPLAAVAFGVVAVVYVPHVLAVGPRVLGYLPQYLTEEGYDDGRSRFSLLRPWLPDTVALVVAMMLLAGVAIVVARRGDARRPWVGGVVLVGLAFAVGSVTYPWYALLLVVLVALDGRAAWLAVAAAAYPGYLAIPIGWPFSATQRIAYGLALAVVAWSWWRRRTSPVPGAPAGDEPAPVGQTVAP